MEMPTKNRDIEKPASARRPSGGRAAWRPSQLRAVVLLGGTVRNAGFGAAIKRSLLDLPIGGGINLLQHWGNEVSQLCSHLGMTKIPVRLVIGRTCFSPQGWVEAQGVHLAVERDPVEFRGTGGVLRDLAQDYDDNDLLLVATAHMLSMEPLTHRVDQLFAGSGDVRLLAGLNMVPAGLFVLRCGALRELSTSGFVDLKEQGLPTIAKRHSVQVVEGSHLPAYSIRRWNDYLAALRARHQPEGPQETSPYEENWQPMFRIVEKGAIVDPLASIHDSVILAGRRVDAKATVVRSLVGPDGIVQRGQTVFGEMVTGAGLAE